MTLDIRIRHILVQVSFNRRQVELVNCNVCLFRMTSVEDMEGVLNTNFQPKTDMPCFSEINAKYKHLTCRLCLCSSGSSGTLCDIHGSMVRKGCTVASAICDLLRLEVSSTDCYPQLVCLECLKKLSEFQSFKDTCLQAKINFDMGLQSNAVLIHPIDQEGKYGTQSPDITTNIPGNYELKDTDDQHFILPSDGMVIENNFTSEIEIKEEFIENSDLRDPLSPGPEHNNMEQALEENDPLKTDESEDCIMQLGKDDRKYESEDCSFTNPRSPNFLRPKDLLIDERLGNSNKQNNSNAMKLLNTNNRKRVKNGSSGEIHCERLDENSLAPVKAINWKCNACDICFPERKYLLNHYKLKHDVKKRFQCDCCYQIFYRKESLEDHKKIQGHDRPFKCKECNYCFSNEKFLENHQLSHISNYNPLKHKCELCDRKFSNEYFALRHAKLHTGGPFKCDTCGYESMQKASLSRHFKQTHGNKPHQCCKCPKKFFSRFKLERHFYGRHVKKEFHCDGCRREFHTAEMLEKHRRIHNHVYSYECEFCRRKFYREANYQSHMKLHSGDVPFICDACGKEFIYKIGLHNHIRRVHMPKTHSCSVCDKKFSYKSILNIHMTLHTNERNYVCEVCGKTFRLQEGLKSHNRTHTGEKPYCCGACNKRFSQKQNLTSHIKLYCKKLSGHC